MPIYEYRCESCGHELDALQKLRDDPLKDCPACESASLRRLVSAPSFRLKGDGWYETDFKSDKETKRNLVERPSDSKGDQDKKKSAENGKSSKQTGKSDADSKTGSKADSKSGPKSDSKSKGSGSATA